jgi:hypothetical protein
MPRHISARRAELNPGTSSFRNHGAGESLQEGPSRIRFGLDPWGIFARARG